MTTVHLANTYSSRNPFPPTPIHAGFQPGEPFTLVRPLIASVSAPDAGPFDGTTVPPLTEGFGCDRYETVFLGAKWTSGSGAIQVTPMFYDVNMNVWVDFFVAGAAQLSDNLDGSGTMLSELRVFGRHAVFVKISAMTGGPLVNVELYAAPGQGRNYAFFG